MENEMKIKMSTITRWVMIGGSVAVLGACGSSAVDNTALEPSRETRINELAAASCDRYRDCNGYGTGSGQTYQTETDCRADFQKKAATLWPDDKCGSGQINSTRYDACVASAKNVACGGGILDTVAALADCNADKVCTDPPQ
jgi:hypothetical protein